MAQWQPPDKLRKNSADISSLTRDWGVKTVSKKTGSQEGHPTTDEKFYAQYAKAGLQPQGLGDRDDAAEKAVVRERRNAARREAFESDLAAAAYQEELMAERQAAFIAETMSNQNQPSGGGVVGKTTDTATRAMAMAKNTPTALWMTSWHTWFWLTFQLPIALLGLIFFTLEVGMQSTWLTRQLGSLLSLASIDTFSLFMLIQTLLYGLFFFGLIATMLTYKLRGQSPVGGDRPTAKAFAIIGCLMGYGMPLLNFFPWIGIYIFVMWTSRD